MQRMMNLKFMDQKARRRYILKQRKKIDDVIKKTRHSNEKPGGSEKAGGELIKTNIEGLDSLIEKGIPRGASILVCGGPGSGKTIFCLQLLYNAAKKKEKCLYLSLEESEPRLKKHMQDFGWDAEELEKKGLLIIKRIDSFAISRSVEALVAKAKGELKMKFNVVRELIPKGFEPSFIVIDSLTALSASFTSQDESYRIYVAQLFKYLEELNLTSFLISETESIPVKFSDTGVEEFLADGVLVFYNIREGNIRERAFEILKLRGVKFRQKIVAMQITGKGISIFPEQEVFEEISDSS